MVAFPVLRRAVVAACALMVIPLFAAGSARASDIAGGFTFDYWVEGPALVDGHRWVVAGSKLPSGACRYSYESLGEATEVGWAIRSVAVDMSHCAKLFEDGFPTSPWNPPTPDQLTTVEVLSGELEASDGEADMTTSSNAAWQEVVWKDLFGDLVNLDITQIDWSYNGSTVTSGSVAASFAWRSGTGWIKLYSHKSGYVDSAGAYYFGNTWSGFKNSTFCFMLPTVYTYYYHNKLWGYPNGTAVRSQSSDSIDECAPLHVEIYSEYGHII